MIQSPPGKPVPPHPLLTTYYTSQHERSIFIRRLFDRSAAEYDSVNTLLSFGSGRWYRREALRRAGLGAGMRVLDLATGTGLVAREALRLTGTDGMVVGLDLSRNMLAETRAALGLACVQARAEAIPVAESSVDFVTMGYALRHVTSLEDTFREYHRVLKPGGKLLILEVTKPAGRVGAWFFRLYFGRVYPFLTRLFTRSADARDMMRYYWETMDACVPPAAVLAALNGAGLAGVKRTVILGLFSEYTAVKPAGNAG